MNELDKQSPAGDEITRENTASEACVLKSESSPADEASESEKVCAEESSPALDIAEEADDLSGEGSSSECVETTSPSLDLAEAADKDEEEESRSYHSMSKSEMVAELKKIKIGRAHV